MLGPAIVFLSWQGNTTAGTTDTKEQVDEAARGYPLDFGRGQALPFAHYSSPSRGRTECLVWLVAVCAQPKCAEGTEGLVRNHLMTVSQSGLVTIAVEMVDVGSYGGGDGRLGC